MASKSRNSTPPTTRPAAPRTTAPADAANRVALNNTKSPNRPFPDEDQVRARAYALWEQAGRPEGDGLQFWLEAEQELADGGR
jgi:hypothetical protein